MTCDSVRRVIGRRAASPPPRPSTLYCAPFCLLRPFTLRCTGKRGVAKGEGAQQTEKGVADQSRVNGVTTCETPAPPRGRPAGRGRPNRPGAPPRMPPPPPSSGFAVAGRRRGGTGGTPGTIRSGQLSKSATKAPRAGIDREKKPGIPTILLTHPGSTRVFATDLDKRRRHGLRRGRPRRALRQPGGPRGNAARAREDEPRRLCDHRAGDAGDEIGPAHADRAARKRAPTREHVT